MRAKIQLYNQDCLIAMKDMPDNAFELSIVDPPYGIGVAKVGTFGGRGEFGKGKYNPTSKKSVEAKNYGAKEWDNKIPEDVYFKELLRVSKNQIIWGGNYFIQHLYNTSCFIVWDKVNGGSNFSDCELAWSSFKTAVRKFTFKWNGMLQQNMRKECKEIRIHPTQKPVQLYKWLLQNYAKEGDKILDTHLGSGSIAIACWDLGFDLTGYEIDKEYYDNACLRLERHKAQGQLF